MNQNFKYISDYLKGLLSEVEKKRFKEKLLTDDEFLSEFLRIKQLKENQQDFDKEYLNDPEYERINKDVIRYLSSSKSREENDLKDFINNSSDRLGSYEDAFNKRQHINRNNLDDIAALWSYEWVERNKKEMCIIILKPTE
jgi:hypothetical protein